jgi:hypothetical protein
MKIQQTLVQSRQTDNNYNNIIFYFNVLSLLEPITELVQKDTIYNKQKKINVKKKVNRHNQSKHFTSGGNFFAKSPVILIKTTTTATVYVFIHL